MMCGLLACSSAAFAAMKPTPAPEKTNLNSHSVAAPVILKRGGEAELPDISEIFGGYGLDELINDIPHVPDAPRAAANSHNTIEDGLVILELRLGKTIINDAFIGYRVGEKLLLPIGQLADALQFPIQIDLDTKRAEGWFSEEDKTFLLDAAQQRITLSGQVASLPSDAYSIQDDDIFVDSRLLSEWFSIAFDVAYDEQLVTVSGANNTRLPAELFAEREGAREALRLRVADASDNFPLVREPYHLATVPFADVYVSHSMDDRSRPSTRTNSSVLMNGDFLYMQQSSYITYDRETGLGDARFTLSRKDPEGQLFQADEAVTSTWLGATANDWKLTDITLGDMVSKQMPLTMLNQNGRGVVISNQPLDRSSRYDRTTIRGDIQPGWDIELYRDDELLAFQRSNSNGRYEFDDIPLLSGLNIIRLVFYGPFGQTREEIQRILVNPNIAEKGKSYMRFTAMQQGTSLLGGTSNSGAFASNFTVGLNSIPITSSEGETRLAFEYEYGLLDSLALYTQASHTPITGNLASDAVTLGLGGVWQDIYGRVDIAKNDANGQAIQLTTQTNIMGLNLSLEHQQFDDFLSDYTENINDPVTARTTGRIDGSVKIPVLPRMSLGVAAARTSYTSGRVRDELNQRTTSNLFGVASLNHNATFTRDHYANGAPDTQQTRGNLLLNLPAFGAFLRGGVSYSIAPETAVENAALAIDVNFSEDIFARGELFRQISGDTLNSLNASITKRFEHFSLGTSAGADDRGNIFAGLSLNFAIGQEPQTGNIRTYGDPVSSNGMVSARTYIDANHNHQKDADEEAIAGTSYLINGGIGSSHTQDKIDDTGTTLIKTIPTYVPASITINPSSLEDPFLIAGDGGVHVVARPGVPVMLDFSVRHAADVEGLVTISRNGETKEASNVLVEAIDKDGKMVRSARSAFDGVYLLELVPSGTYTIRISDTQSKRLGFKQTSEQTLTIVGDEEYIQDINLHIRR